MYQDKPHYLLLSFLNIAPPPETYLFISITLIKDKRVSLFIAACGWCAKQNKQEKWNNEKGMTSKALLWVWTHKLKTLGD